MSKSSDEQTTKFIVGCVALFVAIPVAFILMVASIVIEGFCFYKVWNWFLPEFFNVPAITLAIGMAFSLFSTLWNNPTSLAKNDETSTLKCCSHAFLRPAIVLLFGWLIHTYCMGLTTSW